MEVIFPVRGRAKHRVHGLALITQMAKYSGTWNPEGQMGTTMVKMMKMGTSQMSPASSPTSHNMGLSGEITEPAAFLLSEGELAIAQKWSQKEQIPICLRAALRDQLWCPWAACPQSTHGADCVFPSSLGDSCWTPLLPFEPWDNSSSFLWLWIHPGGHMRLVWKGTCTAELLWQGAGESHASIPARVSLATPAPASLYTSPSSLQSRPRLSPSFSHTNQRWGEFSEPCVHSVQILMEDALALNPLSACALNLPLKDKEKQEEEEKHRRKRKTISASHPKPLSTW